MVVVSKIFFDAKIRPNISCKNVVHPWTTNCAKANLILVLTHCCPGVFYFYLSIYLLNLLTERKKINKVYLKKTTIKFLRSWCYGVSYAALTLSGVCLNYKILGTFHYHSVGFIPGLLAGLSLLFEGNKNRLLNTLLWTTLVIEALFKNLYHFHVINYSVFRETLMFMIVSSFLMYLMQRRTRKCKRIPPSFWIYIPSNHKTTFALKDYFKEILQYFGFGYGLSSARSLISGIVNFRKQSIKILLKAIFNEKHFTFGMVLGAYAALFRGSFLLLKKYCNETTSTTLAGFIAGISYSIKPTTNVLAIGIVTIIQILFKEFFKSSRSAKALLTMLIYMISNGILLQNRILAHTTCPKYYFNMLTMASKGLIDNVHVRLVNKFIN